MLVSRRAVSLVAVMLLTTVTMVACYQPDRGEAQDTPTESADEKENDKSSLRYDDQTFDHWRNLWQTELKTERRTEAIRALAAFGRAGYGKEAVEAILDVAEQYDFNTIDDSSEGKLKKAVLDSFTRTTTSRISEVYWLPLLQERLAENPSKWKSLAFNLLYRLYTENDSTKKRLQDLARHADSTIREAASVALIHADRNLEDPEIFKLIKTALSGNDTNMAVLLLNNLRFRHIDRLPEQFSLLFHKDPQVRRSAQQILPGVHWESQILVLDLLFQVLDDPQRADDHVAALRAIAAMAMGNIIQQNKQQVVKRLQQVLVEGDRSLLTPTLVALGSLEAASGEIVVQRLPFELSKERAEELSEAIERMPEEKRRIVPGGGFGGGGGFF